MQIRSGHELTKWTLHVGNEMEGMAIIEAFNTTLFIPEGRKFTLDKRKFIWME